jgi:hypothetical protein
MARGDYAKTHETKPHCQEADLSDGGDDVWGSESDSDGEEYASVVADLEASSNAEAPTDASSRISSTQDRDSADSEKPQLGRCIIPSLGIEPRLKTTAESVQFGKDTSRRDRTKHVDISQAEIPAHLVKNYCLFRTTQHNVELQPFDREATSVELNYLITRDDYRSNGTFPWDLRTSPPCCLFPFQPLLSMSREHFWLLRHRVCSQRVTKLPDQEMTD